MQCLKSLGDFEKAGVTVLRGLLGINVVNKYNVTSPLKDKFHHERDSE